MGEILAIWAPRFKITSAEKPWMRDPDVRDQPRSVILDVQTNSERCMKSTVEPEFLKLVEPLDDDMQVQVPTCLQVERTAMDVQEGAQALA